MVDFFKFRICCQLTFGLIEYILSANTHIEGPAHKATPQVPDHQEGKRKISSIPDSDPETPLPRSTGDRH